MERPRPGSSLSLPLRRQPLAQPPKVGSRSFDGTPYAATSYANVQFAVFVACMGALCFGYHLGVLNGPLPAIAAELGFAGQPLLEGMVGCLASIMHIPCLSLYTLLPSSQTMQATSVHTHMTVKLMENEDNARTMWAGFWR